MLLLQLTAGEASAFVYATMAIPMLVWAVYSSLVLVFAFARKRYGWVAANIGALGISVFALGGYSFGTPALVQQPTLRVMTLNVQLFNNHTIHEVAEAIKSEAPDIVFLQELPTTGQEKRFAELLVGYTFANVRRLGILSKHPIGQQNNWALGFHGRHAFGGEIDFNGTLVTVINVHLQHFPSDNLTATPKAAQNLLIEIEWLERAVTSLNDSPLIIAGDLNSVPQGRANRMLRLHLTDAFAATSRGFGYTLPSSLPLRRIDYIYTGNGLTPTASHVPEFIISDHRAVVAEFALPK